jgi:dTDP-4-dehydrorhamnose reductase
VSVLPRILIAGAAGQVGRELLHSFAGRAQLIPCDRATLDLSSPEQIRARIREAGPDVIVNAGAYTAVDRAESEPDLARAINTQAPGILAEEAHRTGALLIHYSTDYVFDGTKSRPWSEDDPTGPLNIYGATKLAGEAAIHSVGGRYLIFRTSWVYGPRGKNFVFTMLRLGRERDTLSIVDDQFGAPTSSIEIANETSHIALGILDGQFGSPSTFSGIYNMTCSGSVSWCGFARAIFARAPHLLDGKTPAVNAIPSSAFPTPARRPLNSVLSNEKLAARFGIRLAPWQNALDAVLRQITAGNPAA